jgi:hypothetical protein
VIAASRAIWGFANRSLLTKSGWRGGAFVSHPTSALQIHDPTIRVYALSQRQRHRHHKRYQAMDGANWLALYVLAKNARQAVTSVTRRI